MVDSQEWLCDIYVISHPNVVITWCVKCHGGGGDGIKRWSMFEDIVGVLTCTPCAVHLTVMKLFLSSGRALLCVSRIHVARFFITMY